MQSRGEYEFQVEDDGAVVYTPANIERLTRLLLDWNIIDGWGGPGTRPDDQGAWHVFCHLAAAAAVHRLPNGTAGWSGITFDPASRRYIATLCREDGEGVAILPVASSEARTLLGGSRLIGFAEGASRGHILDRDADDPGDPDRDDRRQDYDREASSEEEGGPVWEHWTTSRDIVTTGSHGAALVDAYLLLLSTLGGRFAATVARGRGEPEYGHVIQLCAMVRAGLVTVEDALWEVQPRVIPPDVERVLREATPTAVAAAAQRLAEAGGIPTYFMYERKRDSFVPARLLKSIAATFGGDTGAHVRGSIG